LGLKEFGLGAKEGILLHLLTFNRYKDDFSCPKGATQPGISGHLGIDRSYVSFILSKLIEDRSVFEKTTHVQGEHRMKKAYFLTDPGYLTARELSERVLSCRLKFSLGGEGHDLPLEDAAKLSGKGPLDLILALDPAQTCDLDKARIPPEPAKPSPPAAAPPIPHVRNFVGRQEEMEACDRWMGTGSPMLVVSGIAGQGKTALCSELIQRWAGKGVEFIYTRLTSWGTEGSFMSDVAVALKGMQRPGFSELISEKGRVDWEAFYSVLAREARSRKLCLIVDDLHEHRDTDVTKKLIDVLLQLGPQGLRSIVCSREELGIHDPRKDVLSDVVGRIRLGGLDRPDVERYLRFENIETDQDVFALTKGHPLFLNLYMHFYKEGGAKEAQRSIREFLQGEVLSRLAQGSRNLLDILTQVRGGATEEMLLDLDSKDLYFSPEAIRSLMVSNILFWQEGRLALHDLVKEVCSEGMSAARRRDIHTILFEHYNERFEEYSLPGRMEFEQVLDKIHVMKEMLHHQSFFASLPPRVALLTELGEEMTSVSETDEVLGLTEGILKELGQGGKQCADDMGVPAEGLVSILILNGWCNSVKGEEAKANEAYVKALEIASECNLDDLQGRCLNALGTTLLRKGEVEKAKGLFELAIRMLRRPKDLSKAQSNLGVAYWQKGELDKALELMERTLALSRGEGDTMGTARALTNKGIILWQMGRHQQSLDIYNEALDICTKNRFTHTLSMLHDNIGEVHLSMGDREAAYEHFSTSMALAEGLGYKWQMAQAKKNLAMLTTDRAERQAMLREAIQMYMQIGANAECEKVWELLENEKMGV